MAPPSPWRLRPIPVLIALVALFEPTAADPTGRQAELFENGPKLLNHEYMHAHYEFSLMRKNMARQGTGELWLSFTDDNPRLRLRGAARSPRFGDGEITIVVDSSTRMMYALFKLGALHEEECLKYPFPNPREKANADRLKLLQWREEQVMNWQAKEANTWDSGSKLLEVNWTKANVLEFFMSNGAQVNGIHLKRRDGERIIKTVALQGIPERGDRIPESAMHAFGPPSNNCVLAKLDKDPLARVELKPPHQKSSALNDLLILLADRSMKWPQLFIMLSAITVPGDVSVMIEDPEPPHPETLGGVAFDYTATVFSRGKKHTSDGSIWLNVAERAFRLRGEAKQTLVGPLSMDVIARGDPPKIYANVNVPDQKEQECVVYDYPELNQNSTNQLKKISRQGLSFFAIAELGGEDCGIFVAPLARGRWIHVWVDMEADNPHAILRSEIHKSGQVLRSTDVLRWRTGEDVGMSMVPKPKWGCTSGPHESQLAHLGLHEMHKRSIQLQDALYSLHNLSREFAMLEILGLTGDVAIMIQEPEPPELWRLPAVSFNYSLSLGSPQDPVASGGHTFTGIFAADLIKGSVRMTASAEEVDASTISLSLELGHLAVRIQRYRWGVVWDEQCLSLTLDEDSGTDNNAVTQTIGQVGIFDRVEAIGDQECNKFSFLGTGAHSESVDFWFSKEESAVCQLEVITPEANGENQVGAHINVPTWEPATSHIDPSLANAPNGWDCTPASQVEQSWLSLASKAPPSSLPAAVALAKLAEAGGVVGLLPPRAADTLSRLVITSPVEGVTTTARPETTPPPISIFSPDLKTFAFQFTSTIGQGLLDSPLPESAASAHVGPVGRGEAYVDLEHQRLYLRSEAINMSAGVPQVESRILFRGDRRRLYVRTTMKSENFEQCWSVSYHEDSLPLPADKYKRNPFIRATSQGRRFPLSGSNGEAEKYVFPLDHKKRVELFVDGSSSLVAMNLNDLSRNNSSGIVVRGWTTAPLDEEIFQPNDEWKCLDLRFHDFVEDIAQWDLIRVFFETNPNPLEDVEERRLHTV